MKAHSQVGLRTSQAQVCTQKNTCSPLMALGPCKPSWRLTLCYPHTFKIKGSSFLSELLSDLLRVPHKREDDPSQRTAVAEADFKCGFYAWMFVCRFVTALSFPSHWQHDCSRMKIWEKNVHLTGKPDKPEMMLTFEQKTNPESFRFHVHKGPRLPPDNLVTLSNMTWS